MRQFHPLVCSMERIPIVAVKLIFQRVVLNLSYKIQWEYKEMLIFLISSMAILIVQSNTLTLELFGSVQAHYQL